MTKLCIFRRISAADDVTHVTLTPSGKCVPRSNKCTYSTLHHEVFQLSGIHHQYLYANSSSPPHIYPTTGVICQKIVHVHGYTKYYRRSPVDSLRHPNSNARPHSRTMDQNSVRRTSPPCIVQRYYASRHIRPPPCKL